MYYHKTMTCQNMDLLFIDPCYLSEYYDPYDFDEDEDDPDFIVHTWGDGFFSIVKGRYEDMVHELKKLDEIPEAYYLGGVAVETGRFGVYDYQEAIKSNPKIQRYLKGKNPLAAVIKNFTGTLYTKDDERHDTYVIGISEDGEHDFFTIYF